MPQWIAIKAFITSPLFKYLALTAVICGILYGIYHAGEVRIQTKWDVDKAKVQLEIEKLKLESEKVTIKVETAYVDRVKTITVKGDTITQYVDRYITQAEDKACTIPNNFVLLHDLAVKNITLPEPGAAK